MSPDGYIKSFIQPSKGLSLSEIGKIYDAKVKHTNRQNAFYNAKTGTITLKMGYDSLSFCHELAHHLQRKHGEWPDFEFNSLLAFERQAERIAYYLHKAHFYWVPHQKFNAYIPQWEKDFLWEWHFGDPSRFLESADD